MFSSLFFYAAWDYRFLSLILFSSTLDYFIGLAIDKNKPKEKKIILGISIFANIGILFVFKYFNFFIDSFNELSDFFGFQTNIALLNIILPVGISFYTFQTLSYTIDIYNGKIKPTKDWIKFATYVCFFPQLVAGPIERASRILPQLSKKRNFEWNQGKDGIRKILIGFFKKVVIADSLGPMVDYTFSYYQELSFFALLLGVLYFTIQIYCDFSGYSDIAIGTSKLFGIDLMENFNYPLFSRNISEFWRKWHISMTSWFTDYIYYPLKLKFRYNGYSVNLFVLVFYFFIIGFWHGANWTYIFFGLYHCLFFIPTVIYPKFYKLKTHQISFNKIFPSVKEVIRVLTTFIVVAIGFVFFRSDSIEDALLYLLRLFSAAEGEIYFLNPANNVNATYYILYVLIYLLMDYYMSLDKKETNLQRRLFNTLLLLFILFFAQIDQAESFIYFQF